MRAAPRTLGAARRRNRPWCQLGRGALNREPVLCRRVDQARSRAINASSTTPVSSAPIDCWNCRIAAAVLGPSTPSTANCTNPWYVRYICAARTCMSGRFPSGVALIEVLQFPGVIVGGKVGTIVAPGEAGPVVGGQRLAHAVRRDECCHGKQLAILGLDHRLDHLLDIGEAGSLGVLSHHLAQPP